jgi:hypothetical protein
MSNSLRAYPLLIESKAGSKFLFYRTSLPENRFALFRTHSEWPATRERWTVSTAESPLIIQSPVVLFPAKISCFALRGRPAGRGGLWNAPFRSGRRRAPQHRIALSQCIQARAGNANPELTRCDIWPTAACPPVHSRRSGLTRHADKII